MPGRGLIGRGPPVPAGRPAPPGLGRRMPGGGGIGRPDWLSGRPGGGGIGRPDWLSGGRCAVEPSGASPAPVRWVGRMVVGPSGDTVRVGAGFTTGALDRTTLVTGSAGAAGSLDTGADASAAGALGASANGVGTRLARTVAGAAVSGSATGAGALAALVAFVALAALAASSGCTSRRSPSASARRRMRSAWASSIDAEGLDAPIPSFWASASNSLLVRPSSLESSCTRIFFCAKTFPCFSCPR